MSARQLARLLLATIGALLIAHSLCSFAFSNLRFSMWFDTVGYAQRLNAEFAAELAASRDAIATERTLPRHDRSNASFCIAIASAPRAQPHLTVLLGSFLRGTSAVERRNTRVIVVTAAHEQHAEAESLAALDGIELLRFDDDVRTTANESTRI